MAFGRSGARRRTIRSVGGTGRRSRGPTAAAPGDVLARAPGGVPGAPGGRRPALSGAGLAGLLAQDLGFAAPCVASASVAATGSAMWMFGRRALGMRSPLRQSGPASAEPV